MHLTEKCAIIFSLIKDFEEILTGVLHFAPVKGIFFSKPLEDQNHLNHFWPKIRTKILILSF